MNLEIYGLWAPAETISCPAPHLAVSSGPPTLSGPGRGPCPGCTSSSSRGSTQSRGSSWSRRRRSAGRGRGRAGCGQTRRTSCPSWRWWCWCRPSSWRCPRGRRARCTSWGRGWARGTPAALSKWRWSRSPPPSTRGKVHHQALQWEV